jgi:hypothetical protein
MSPVTKKWLWIALGAFAIAGTGIGAYFYFRTPKEESDPTKEEKKPDGSAPKYTPKSDLPSTPFKNALEGNAFREWVNTNHPQWAQQHELDAVGGFNNAYIREAYQEFHAEYAKATKPAITELQSGFKPGQEIYINPSKALAVFYSYPSAEAKYVDFSVKKDVFKDKPIATFVTDIKRFWVKVRTKHYGQTKEYYMTMSDISKSPY